MNVCLVWSNAPSEGTRLVFIDIKIQGGKKVNTEICGVTETRSKSFVRKTQVQCMRISEAELIHLKH